MPVEQAKLLTFVSLEIPTLPAASCQQPTGKTMQLARGRRARVQTSNGDLRRGGGWHHSQTCSAVFVGVHLRPSASIMSHRHIYGCKEWAAMSSTVQVKGAAAGHLVAYPPHRVGRLA